MSRRDAAAIAASKGASPNSRFAKAHAVFARFCTSQAESIRIAAAAIAERAGTFSTRSADHAQAVLERSWALHCPARIIRGEDEAIEASRGPSSNDRTAQAHAVMDRSCGPHSVIRLIADEAAASRNGQLSNLNVDTDHAMPDRSRGN